jgi:hypothetical protein
MFLLNYMGKFIFHIFVEILRENKRDSQHSWWTVWEKWSVSHSCRNSGQTNVFHNILIALSGEMDFFHILTEIPWTNEPGSWRNETHPSVLARPSLRREASSVCPGCRGGRGRGHAAGNIASNNAGTCHPSGWYCATARNHLHNTTRTRLFTTYTVHALYTHKRARGTTNWTTTVSLTQPGSDWLPCQRNVGKQPTRHACWLPSLYPPPSTRRESLRIV